MHPGPARGSVALVAGFADVVWLVPTDRFVANYLARLS
jgi:hypothetical protein